MKEDFLHFLWKFKLFNTLELFTDEGESIQILTTGTHNHNSGPDFSNAQLKIGDKLWSGNVEIHLKSSDWYNHSHQYDKAYKNVILHVVYENDKPVFLNKNGDLPVIELKNIIKPEYLQSYEKLEESRGWIPCASQFPELDEFKLSQWLERLMISRLQRKSTDVIRLYFECNKDWNETFYRWLARGFGFKINANAFEQLAEKIPLKILKKHANSLFQLESILFGVAGMLDEDFHEEYPRKMQKEFMFLSKKYEFHKMNKSVWKFSKTHPSNFPTKRIAQLAAYLSTENGTFSKILEMSVEEGFFNLFSGTTSGYWKDHYRLDKPTEQIRSGRMGKSSVDVLIINAVSTLLFAYGQKMEDEQMMEKGVATLEKINPEKNRIIRNWNELGVKVKSARDTQALIELKREHCEFKKCLTCLIGTEIIKNN